MIRAVAVSRELISRINSALENARAYIVGVDGLSGAGKSTFARELGAAFESAEIVQMDDFYQPMGAHEETRLGPVEGYERFFDWGRLRDQVLEPLRRSERARYQRFDWNLTELAEWVDVPSHGLVIVEGVYTLRPELREYYDLRVFVATSAAERSRRLVDRRHNPPERIARWTAAEEWYLAEIRPQSAADVIVSGE